MNDIWRGATWNENGELVANIYKEQPKHTYKEIDCGGECGGCVALIVDGAIVMGPPFHPHCGCSLSQSDIDKAQEQESNMTYPVAPDRNTNPKDVKWLKNALNKLGFYKPDSRAGESNNNLNEYPNQNLFNAINKFQREHNLSEHGSVAPGHQTEAKINNELKNQTKEPQADFEYNGSTFTGKIEPDNNQYAVFDGKSLAVYNNGEKIAEWAATAGREGYQDPEYQKVPSKGPLPAGTYVARKNDFQEIDPLSKVIGWAGLGNWKGSTMSWGSSRVWLEPSKETNTFGRAGFSIHGGWEPGSAGCIDLTSGMDDFAKWFKTNGKDLILYVEY